MRLSYRLELTWAFLIVLCLVFTLLCMYRVPHCWVLCMSCFVAPKDSALLNMPLEPWAWVSCVRCVTYLIYSIFSHLVMDYWNQKDFTFSKTVSSQSVHILPELRSIIFSLFWYKRLIVSSLRLSNDLLNCCIKFNAKLIVKTW